MNFDFFKYILALLIFGSNGIVASFIALTSYEIVFFRTMIGALFLILLFFGIRKKPQFPAYRKEALYVVISGVAMGICWMFLYEAYAQVGVSIASLAYYCGPVLVMIAAPIIFREKLHLSIIAGFAAVLLGMLFVNGGSLFTGGMSFGLFCGIMSAVMYAVMLIFNKKAVHITGLENPMIQLTSSFVTVAVFTLAYQGLSFQIPAGSILPLLFLGVVNTGFGCYLYFSAIGKLSVQTVAIVGYLEPLSALVFSAVILSEHLGFIQVIGAVLILGGAMFGELFSHKQLPWKKDPEDGA